MKEKPTALWILWSVITVIATTCEMINFDENTILQMLLKKVGIILFFICIILFIISLINTLIFYLNCEKIEPSELDGMHCTLNLIKDKEYIKYNKKVFVTSMTKNCYYTDNASTSHVTYIITCVSKQICNKLFFSIGGGTDLDNIKNINYCFISNENEFLDNDVFFKDGNININTNSHINHIIGNNLRKALTIELPLLYSMKKDDTFQIVISYTYKNCMLPKCDGTSYITDMFPSGVKVINTNLKYPNNILISELGVYKLLFNSRKKLIDSPQLKKTDDYTIITWSKEYPKGTYLIERNYETN